MSNNTPDYEDNLYFDSQNTKNEQQKDLCITVEKQVWESTLNRSMVLQAENEKLKELLKECKEWFDWYHIDTGTGKEYIESWHKKGHEIHKQLDEALK